MARVLPWLALVFVLILGGGGAAALAQTLCPDDDPTLDYNCPLGPRYLIPGLTDLNGWNQPEHYTNILAGDIDGDQRDELVVRGAAGVEVYRFNKTLGRWPQVQVSPMILSDADGSTQPQFYQTLRLAAVDPEPSFKEQPVVRSAQGVVVYEFAPGSTPDAGTWTQLNASGPMADADCFSDGKCWGDDPAYHSTIQLGDFFNFGTAKLIGRGGDGLEVWTGGSGPDGSWVWLPGLAPGVSSPFSDAAGFDQPQHYRTIRLADIDGDGGWEVLGRAPTGMVAYRLKANHWSAP